MARLPLIPCLLPAFLACASQGGRPGDPPHLGRNRPFLDPALIPSEKELGRSALRHVRNLVAFGPRVPGSKARKKAADYIAARLRALGLKPIREAWVDEKEKLPFENLRVVFPGWTKKRLLLSTHYDTKREIPRDGLDQGRPFLGANDGGSGSGLLLALAEHLSRLGIRRPTIEMVWFDGEESLDIAWNGAKRALFGSRAFVKRHLKKGHPYGAMILLDMVGHKKLAIDLDEASTPGLVPPLRRAAEALGYGKYFFQQKTEVEDDHLPFLAKGLPCLDLIQFEKNPEWHTQDDDLRILSARSLAIVGRTLWRALPGIQRKFLR